MRYSFSACFFKQNVYERVWSVEGKCENFFVLFLYCFVFLFLRKKVILPILL